MNVVNFKAKIHDKGTAVGNTRSDMDVGDAERSGDDLAPLAASIDDDCDGCIHARFDASSLVSYRLDADDDAVEAAGLFAGALISPRLIAPH